MFSSFQRPLFGDDGNSLNQLRLIAIRIFPGAGKSQSWPRSTPHLPACSDSLLLARNKLGVLEEECKSPRRNRAKFSRRNRSPSTPDVMLICPSGPGPRRVHNVTEEAGFPLPPLEPPSPPHPWRVSHQRSLRTNIPPVPNYLGGIGRSLTLQPSCNHLAESSPTVNLPPIRTTTHASA